MGANWSRPRWDPNDCCARTNWVCWCLCCPPCIPCWVHKLLFPVHQSSYRMTPQGNSYQLQMVDPNAEAVEGLECSYIRTQGGNRIVVGRVRHPRPQRHFTLVISHTNSMDMGMMTEAMRGFSNLFQCDVVAYDYSGYGESEGSPSEEHMLNDIEAVVRHFKLPPNQVVLWGFSLGATPTLKLAAKMPVRGVIVDSGFSKAKDLCRSLRCCIWNDFRNIDDAKLVVSPTLIIHALDDYTVAFCQAQRLFTALPNPVEPLWFPHGGHMPGFPHSDEEGETPEAQQRTRDYLNRIQRFLDDETTSNQVANANDVITTQPSTV